MADHEPEIDVPISNRVIYKNWLKYKHLGRKSCCDRVEKQIANKCPKREREKILKILKNLEKRWKASQCTKSKFYKNNHDWLSRATDVQIEPQKNCLQLGRPSIPFQNSGKLSKQKKVKKLISVSSTNELLFATQVSLRKQGRRTAAKLIEEAVLPQPTSNRKARQIPTAKPMTSAEALALIINTRSSKSIYLAYRKAAKECSSNIYPSWHKILKAKQLCYPDSSSITISETAIEINLQDILNLTALRICQLQEETIDSSTSIQLTLTCKWGIDCSSGQSNYRHLLNANSSDSSVVIISFVPLQLCTSDNKNEILWKNPVPSSVRFCRAIKFIFAKETPELTKEETENIKNKINNLNIFQFKDKSIMFEMLLTMVDGKVCFVLTETKSTQVCYICLAKPKEMNDISTVNKKQPKIENYSFGLSTLHSWIRFFECCLHISYRLNIKSWQAKGENKEKMNIRKQIIVDGLKKELGILVDQPKPGYGSTNTGNTARIFFRNSKIAASITGLDETLIHRFYVILQTISSGCEINTEKFGLYTLETAERYVSLYPWFYMPTSVHKVLVHGAKITEQKIKISNLLGNTALEKIQPNILTSI